MTDPQRKPTTRTSPLVVMGAAAEVGLTTGALAVGGWWLDGRWGTFPWVMLAGLAIGLVGGFYRLYKVGKRFFD